LKIFKIVKSLKELFEAFFVLLPDREVLVMIDEISDFQLVILLLNLASFLANQIPLRRFTKAGVMITLHWRDQALLQRF
jgi:hypothetical protein